VVGGRPSAGGRDTAELTPRASTVTPCRTGHTVSQSMRPPRVGCRGRDRVGSERGSTVRRASVALVLASVLWGTTGTAASLLPGTVSPVAVGAVTMGVGGILLFGLSARRAVTVLGDPAARPWLLLGAVGVVVYPLAFYSAMNLAGVAVGNVVALGSGPVFAALFEWAWERRGPGMLWLACTATAVLGIGLLAVGGGGDERRTGWPMTAGVLLGLLAGLAYALYTYASSRAIGLGHRPRGVMGGMFGVGAVGLVPVLLATGAPLLQSPLTVGVSAYLAVGPMLVAYLLFGIGLATLRSSSATTITLVEPLVATVLAVVVVGERLGVVGWIGLGLILTGVTAMTAARHPEKSP
jgi:DME family drug/metabolite transporter